MQHFRPRALPAAVLALTLAGSACAPADDDADRTAQGDAATAAGGEAARLSVADVGFETPESVLHDPAADVYLVSNINGEPLGRDGNGFITRLRPDGEVEALKWIVGSADGVALHAPKGMALRGDTLFVADIDTLRAFHRTSGEPLGARGVAGASFLNDVSVGPDGTIYVTDTGMDASFEPTGTDAIHRFGGGGADADAAGGTGSSGSVYASGTELAQPNGILADEDGVFVVSFGGSSLQRVSSRGAAPEPFVTLPAGQLDGLVRTNDGSLLVSSWEASAVYRVTADGDVQTVVEEVESPADLGWDAARRRVLIPLFMGNAVEIREIR